MNLVFRILVPMGILILTVLTVRWMMINRPTPEIRRPPPSLSSVEATRLQPTRYQVQIPSQGVVQPRTQSTLIPEVSGRVIWISPNFRDGGFFEEDEVLLKIDPRDYETAVVASQATLAQRQSALELEEAQHDQAVENWRLLGDGGTPNPLTLREPQLAEAKANVESAQARLREAQRNLERAVIHAPYAGRILRKQVDVGQTVSPGNGLATIFAVDYVEIRLPLFNEYLDFIDLPEDYRGEDATETAPKPKVLLTGNYGSRSVTWQGQIVRADGAFDPGSRQLFVVAQVDDPYSRNDEDRPPLKVNQFVEAKIEGDALENVFVVPRTAIRDGREVLIIDANHQIRRRAVTAIWRDKENWIIREQLKPGEVLCTTPMRFAAEGARVVPTIDGVPPQRSGRGGTPGMGRGKRGPGQGRPDGNAGAAAPRNRPGKRPSPQR